LGRGTGRSHAIPVRGVRTGCCLPGCGHCTKTRAISPGSRPGVFGATTRRWPRCLPSPASGVSNPVREWPVRPRPPAGEDHRGDGVFPPRVCAGR